jgi:hypothetical protein
MKRPAAKKPLARKPQIKGAAAKKPAVKKAAAKKPQPKKKIGAPPPGYTINPSGTMLVPAFATRRSTTPASKLREGISKAQSEIKESLQEIAALMTMDFEVAEIEFSISFSADGKFLGFGVGGSTAIKIKIKPIEDNGGD